ESVSPSTYSVTIYAVLFSSKKSNTRTIHGACSNCCSVFASCKNRRRILSAASFVVSYKSSTVRPSSERHIYPFQQSSLTATNRYELSVLQQYVIPNPPWPS